MRRIAQVVATGLVAAVAPSMAALPTSAGTVAAGVDGGCRLVRLATPAGSPWGTVADIERVGGRPTYFGSFEQYGPEGELLGRAVIWRGTRARPQYVGPKGWPVNIAFDLTRSGLVNGVSEDPDTGAQRFWVEDLDSGRLRWLRTSLDGTAATAAWVRRINDRGAAVGMVEQGGGDRVAAVGYRPGSSRPFALPTPRRAAWSEASGINERGDRAGFWAEMQQVGEEMVPFYRPTVWRRGGGRLTLPVPSTDGTAKVVNDREQAGGDGWWGDGPDGHVEAVAWPSFERSVSLGLLPGGGSSSIFGMDRRGRVVGGSDRFAPESPHAFPDDGTVMHSFYWAPGMGPGRVRVLPSLYAVRTGETDWREWHATHVAHASHAGLDQIGAGTHMGFDSEGVPTGAPTVFLDASRCGTTVRTTHVAFWEQQGAARRVQASTADSQSRMRGRLRTR